MGGGGVAGGERGGQVGDLGCDTYQGSTYLCSLTRQFFLSESVLVANPECDDLQATLVAGPDRRIRFLDAYIREHIK